MSNTKYEVYGIGNALIDLEYKVRDSVLSDLGLKKGEMLLVSNDRFNKITEYLNDDDYIGISCGGSVANSMYLMKQLGVSVFFAGIVGNDKEGVSYKDSLQDIQLDNNLTPDIAVGNSGKSIVLITDEGERTMCTYLGVTSMLSLSNIDFRKLNNSTWLYVEGYLLCDVNVRKVVFEIIKYGRANGVKIAISLSDVNVISEHKKSLLEIFNQPVELLLCNELECLKFSESSSLSDAKEYLKKYAVNFAITKGAEGAMVYSNKTHKDIKAVKTNVVSTVGAGDAFAGAMLSNFIVTGNYFQAATFANFLAKEVVSISEARLASANINHILIDYAKQ